MKQTHTSEYKIQTCDGPQAKQKIFNFENLYEIWSPNFTIIKCMKLLLLLLHFFLKHVTFFNGIGNFEFKNESRSKY